MFLPSVYVSVGFPESLGIQASELMLFLNSNIMFIYSPGQHKSIRCRKWDSPWVTGHQSSVI